jgi:hypothetical protein
MPVNEYDEIISGGKVPNNGNEYLQMAEEDGADQRSNLQQSLFSASTADPARMAQIDEMARKAKLPTAVVERNFDEVSRRSSLEDIDYDKIIDQTPALASWLEDPENAAVGRDDIEALGKLERGARRILPKSADPSRGAFGRAIATGWSDLTASTWHLAAVYGLTDPAEAAQRVAEANAKAGTLRAQKPPYALEFDQIMQDEGGDVDRAVERFKSSFGEMQDGRIYQGLIDYNAGKIQTVAEGLEMLWSAVSRPQGLAYSSLESLAHSFPSLVTGAGFAAAGAALGPQASAASGIAGLMAGTFIGETPVEVGAWINQAMAERGVDITSAEGVAAAYSDAALMAEIRGEAERKGITTAGVDALFSAFAGKLAAGGLTSKAIGKATKTALVAADVATQAVGEGASEFAGQVAARNGLQGVSVGEAIQEGIVSLGHSVGDTVVGTSVRRAFSLEPGAAAGEMLTETERALKALGGARALEEVGAAVGELKNAQNAPERLQALIETAGGTEGGAVYFQAAQWDEYWQAQGLSPAAAAAQILGDNGKAYYEAKAADGQMAVPLADYVAKVATSEHFEGLLPAARTSPDGMSLREASEFLKALPATMDELAAEAAGKTSPIDEADEQIRSQVTEQLIQAGFDPSTAETYSQVYSGIRVMAERAGVDPQELYERYGLQIRRFEGAQDAPGGAISQGPGSPLPGEFTGQAWRAPTGYRHGAKDTAADVVRFETEELGNDLAVPPDVMAELAGRAASDIVWVTRKKSDAARYGKPEQQQMPPGSRIIAEDGDGGYLVLKPKSVTDTPEFKAWFGTSKVVDESGQPKVLYHATRASFRKFMKRFNLAGHFGTVDAANDRTTGLREDAQVPFEEGGLRGENIMPVYLSIQNPVRMKDVHFDEYGTMIEDLIESGTLEHSDLPVPFAARYDFKTRKAEQEAITATIEALKQRGYDGIVYENRIEAPGSDSWIPFEPNQIKSVFNRGTFDPKSPDILFQGEAPPAPVFYSNLERVIEAKMPASAPVSQVLGIIKSSGVKQDELDQVGLAAFLEGKTKVSRDEVLAYIRENTVKIEEDILGDVPLGHKNLSDAVRELAVELYNEELHNRLQEIDIDALEAEAADYAITQSDASPNIWIITFKQSGDTRSVYGSREEAVAQAEEIAETTHIPRAVKAVEDRIMEQLQFTTFAQKAQAELERSADQIADALYKEAIEEYLSRQDLTDVKKEAAAYVVLPDEPDAWGVLFRKSGHNANGFASKEAATKWADESVPAEIERAMGAARAAARFHVSREPFLEKARKVVGLHETRDAEGVSDIPRFNEPDLQIAGGENYRERLFMLPADFVKTTSADRIKLGKPRLNLIQNVRDIAFSTTEWAVLYNEKEIGQIVFRPSRAIDRDFFKEFDGEDAYIVYSRNQSPSLYSVGASSSPIYKTLEEALAGVRASEAVGMQRDEQYTQGHFPRHPNLLFHTRTTEHTLPDGKRMFFLQEVQSDALQGLRKLNIKRAEGKELNGDEQAKLDILSKWPFQNTWGELALKRMIRLAAEKGFDYIGWTTGEQQVDRYNNALRERVDEIEWTKNEKGVRLVGYKKKYEVAPTLTQMLRDIHATFIDSSSDGPTVHFGVDKRVSFDTRAEAREYIESVWKEDPENWKQMVVDTNEKETELSDAIGKAMAGKILSDPNQSGTIEGDDIAISDTGMAGFYDRMLVSAANKIGKRFGVKATITQLEGQDTTKFPTFRELNEHDREALQGAEDFADGGTPVAGTTAVTIDGVKKYVTFILSGNGLNILDKEAYAEFRPDDALTWGSAEEAQRVLKERWYKLKFWASLHDLTGEEHSILPIAEKPGAPEIELAQEEVGTEMRWVVREKEGEVVLGVFDTKDEAQERFDTIQKMRAPSAVHALELTPAMKESVIKEGFALYQGEKETPRGQLRFGPNRQINIDLLKTADLSTFLHETGHFYLEVLGDLAGQADVPAQMRDDFLTVVNWIGFESAEAWRAATPEQRRDAHEQFARGFETYLMEGKAPSAALRSAFARFRAWLISIYRQVRGLNVSLTPEVRTVFDRMLATDAEISEASREQSIQPLFPDLVALGFNADDAAEYAAAIEDARTSAEEELSSKLMAEVAREQKEWWKEQRAGVRDEIEKQVNGMKVYVAIARLQKGKLPDGSPLPEGVSAFKLDKDALLLDYDKALLARLPRPYVYAVDGGIHHDVAAELLGFGSGDEMVMALINAPKREALIERMTDQRMKELHGDMAADGKLPLEAMKAVHNEKRSQLLRRELEILASENLSKLKGLTKKVARPIPPVSAVRAQAERIIASKRTRDIKPSVYQRAEAKAARDAVDAMLRGDFEAAFVAKQRELLNSELYRAAVNANDETAKIVRYMSGFTKKSARERIGKAGAGYLDQIDSILERFDFSRGMTLGAIDKRVALAQWIEQQRAMGVEPELPDTVLNEAFRRHYKDLKYEELVGIRDAVKHVAHLARLKNKLLKAGRDRDLRNAIEEAVASISANAKGLKRKPIETRTPQEDFADGVVGIFASHRKMASLLRVMDGNQDGGVMWELVMRPANEAADAEVSMNEQATVKLKELFSVYSQADLLRMYKRTHIEGVGGLTKMGQLMVALNWGNEDNRTKLMEGRGWSDDQVQSILAQLDERDWKFVQSVWDFIDSYWSEIKALAERVNGVAPEKVEAAQVITPFGTFRGGYFPLKYDDRLAPKAYANQAKELAEQAMHGAFFRGSTRHGHRKARVEGVKLPVRLDFGVIFEHVGQVIHDLSHYEYMIDANRLLGDSDMQSSIIDYHGHEVYKQLRATIKDIAAGDVPAQTHFERALNWIRTGTSIASMGWNLMTSAMQPLGLTQSMVRVGPKWVARGMSRWFSDAARMEDTARWIQQRSTFMRMRAKTQMREINEIRNKTRLRGQISAMEDTYFWLITRLQLVADIPTWLGAYEKALSENPTDEARATALADQAVLDSQGGGQVKDLAQIQRGGPAWRLWTNFYSFFNTTFNLTAESLSRTNIKDPHSIGRLGVDLLLLYVVPAVLGYALRSALKPGDEDDEFIVGVAKELAAYTAGTMVGVREISGAIQGYYGYEGPAGARFFAEASGLVKQISQGEADGAFWRSLNDTAGILLHYPSTQMGRTLRGILALTDGDTDNPSALLAGPPRQ